MRFIVFILLGLSTLAPVYGCITTKSVTVESSSDVLAGYEIVVRLFESGNVIDKVIVVLFRNGLQITNIRQVNLSSERQEIGISIRSGNARQLYDAEYQIRNVLNIESVSIRRL